MNKKVFEDFYKTNYRHALGYVIKRHIPKADAEDLIQDVFLEVFEEYDDEYIKNPKLFFRLLDYRIIDLKRIFKKTKIDKGY